MASAWTRFQNAHWARRAIVKSIVLAMTLLAVCFPHPTLLVRNIVRWQNPQLLIEPNQPALKPLLNDLKPRLQNIHAGPAALEVVQKFVYETIPYAWDWDTWGVADYIPTVAEVVQVGREDCDGQAVLAASLLSNLGYDAELVTDMTHVWVKTDQGETMSPGLMKPFVQSTDAGAKYDWTALVNLPRSIALGIGVFPFERELIIAVVAILLSIRTDIRWTTFAAAMLALVDGLLILRWAVDNPWKPKLAAQWFGLFNLILGFATLYLVGHRARRATRFADKAHSPDPAI